MANEYTDQQRATSQQGGTFQPDYAVTSHGTNTGYTDIRRKQSIEEKIYQICLPMNFLQYFASKNSRTVDQTLYTIMEDQPLPRFDTVKAGITSAVVLMTVDNRNYIRPSHLWKNIRTGEIILVTGHTAVADQISVIRGYGTTAAAAMVAGDKLRRMGSIMSETQLPGAPQAIHVGHSNNTVQFFSRVTGISSIAQEAGIRGLSEWQKMQRDTKYEYMLDKEEQYLGGEFVSDEQGATGLIDSALPDWRGETKGILSYLNETRSHKLDAGGDLTFGTLSDMLHDINRNRQPDGSTVRTGEAGKTMKTMGKYNLVALCGKEGKKALGRIQRSNTVFIKSGEMEYGFDILKMMTDFGTIEIVQHFLLDEELEGHILLLDTNRIRTVKYKGHGVTVRDITPPNAHYKQEEIYSVEGFELMNPECHGMITNV